ncbi:gamma-aminobutyric acid type B receptor subunit 2-like isoform X2 [Ptychodera flava]
MTVAKQMWIFLSYSAVLGYLLVPYCCRAQVPLYIGGFFPLNDSVGEFGVIGPIARDCLSSAQMAIDHVNRDESVLQGYKLDLVVINTQNLAGFAFRKFYDMLVDGDKKKVVMLLGNFADKISEDLAKATPYWNLIQVSYGSHSVALSERKYYPLFFRTIPSSVGFNYPRKKLVLDFNWKKVATIHSTTETFQGATEHMHQILKEDNITVLASETFTQDPTGRLKFLKDKDARIIIGNFYRPQAYLILCEAYQLEMYGPDYVWMILGYDPLRFDEITEEFEELARCKKEQIIEAAEGTWTFTWEIMSAVNRTAIGGLTPEQYRHELMLRSGQMFSERRPGPFAYDAIWAMALALNASIEDIKPQNLEDFDYEDAGKEMVDIFKEKMDKTDFFGVSGPVSFYDQGDRKGVLKVQQIRNGTEVLVGRYIAQTDTIEWEMSAEEIWYRSGGKPPPDEDRTEERFVIQKISLVLFITMTVLAALGIVMAIGLLAFNIYYRNERLIKMSSPNLNNVIIVGCILTYVTICLLGIDRNILRQ